MNLFTRIWNNAHAHGDKAALVFQGKDVSYAQLARSAILASMRLAEAGVSKGDVVALSIAQPVAYFTVALGLARMGATVLPINIADPEERVAPVLARHKVHTLVRDHSLQWRSPVVGADRYLTVGRVLTPYATREEAPPLPPMAEVGPEPWIIALSSGTTGTPKSMAHSHDRAILNSSLSISLRGDHCPRVLVFSGYFISMAMNAVLHELFHGNTVVVTSTRSPDVFFETVERDKPTHVVTSTGTAVQIVAYAQQKRPDSLAACSSVAGITLSGSAVSPALRAAVQATLCPQLEINYGASEAGSMALATPETLAQHPDSAGRLQPWVQMEAVDENDKPVPAGRSGVLRVRNAMVVEGYLGDPKATAAAFRGGWYYPGDTGSVDSGGHLRLHGRTDELLNIGGNKVDPAVIEAVLDAQPGVQESAVVVAQNAAGGSALIGVVVSADGFDELALKKACAEKLGPKHMPARIISIQAIPRNAGGKIMRKELTDRVKISDAK